MIKHFEKNIIGNDYVVGDIHGCYTLLEEQLKNIGFNEETDRLFSVGDLCDRGNQSENAIDWLNKKWFHSIRGNHEQLLIDAFKETYGSYSKSIFLKNGGLWFYGLTQPERLKFCDYFETLPYIITVDTNDGLVMITHADYPTFNYDDIELFLRTKDENYKLKFIDTLLWSRKRIDRNIKTPIENVYRVYHGHTIVKNIKILGNVWFIDTGAFYSKKLTVIDINATDDVALPF